MYTEPAGVLMLLHSTGRTHTGVLVEAVTCGKVEHVGFYFSLVEHVGPVIRRLSPSPDVLCLKSRF